MMGYGDEGTHALFVRLRYARRTPPFKTGRTICTPLTGSVWWTTTRWTGRNTLQASSWIGGSDSTTSKGTRRDRAYLRIATLRKHYGRYRGKVQGEPPGPPSTISIPHTKGTTPDREVEPTELEFAGSEQEGSDQEEGEITQTEGDEPGAFTQMRSRGSDSGSDDTTTGRESWRSARGQELVVLSTPRPRGRGKRRPERGEGTAKRPRMESSSSDRRDGSEESRSGGGRDRPGRCSQRAAGPSTPPRRPIPASVIPRRSPRLTKSAVQDLRSLPPTTKSDRRTAHSRSVSGDERRRGPSRASLSSSDHGQSSQGRRSRSREPTPTQLRNFNIDDFTVVSHTTDSFTFFSEHHFFPGWVRVVSAHTKDRVRSVPCDHNPEEERRVKQRVRRDVETPEVRRFLRQELLKKVGHSWWNRPRVYRYDKDDEREPTQSLRSVVVVFQGQEQPEEALHQQELSPAVPGDRMTLVGPVASPVTSLPHTPGRDIVVAGSTEESPRTREGRLAAATLEQEMGRRSVAEAIQPIRERAVASSSSAERTITREMVAEACDTLIQERHPASPPPPPPVWPESSGSPTESQPAGTGDTGVLAEPPPPQRKLASTHRPQRDGSLRGTERKPESALFSPSPVFGQEQPPPVCSRVPETESSESDASYEPGPKEDPSHLGARPALDLEGDPEAAELDQRRLEGRNHHQLNWSWPSITDWTFRPSRRSVTCLRGPVPRFTSRGRQSGWSEPPLSGDGRRPRPWRSSWEDEGVNITPAGMAHCYNDRSAASMPQISRRTEGCGPPECTIAQSVGCWTDWSPRGPREIESPRA